LIAGMVGESWENWRECVRKTVALSPECVTVYQMELPYNTVFSQQLKVIGQDEPSLAVADWPTKRAWVDYAFGQLAEAGYEVSSAYTMVKDKRRTHFVYRDALWRGADMFGTGVASFGHLNGVHMQNVDSWEAYVGMLDKGELPLGRALPTSPRDRLIREMILQLKTGSLDADYFRSKYRVDIRAEFRAGFEQLQEAELLNATPAGIELTRRGLLEIDRHLPVFFDAQFRSARYT
jgi:oxygen-independent coproporphyrinogen-3 oxidase